MRVEKSVFDVQYPLQRVAEIMIHVVVEYRLHQLAAFLVGQNPLHKANILHAAVSALRALADVEQRQRVGLGKELAAQRSHIRVIFLVVAGQCKRVALLGQCLPVVVIKRYDARVLQADNRLPVNVHALVALFLHSLQTAHKFAAERIFRQINPSTAVGERVLRRGSRGNQRRQE